MKNRNVEFFNLSFLDLLSGALASVIFLFIIVPKGEITIYDSPVTVTYDSLQKKFYGVVTDSLTDIKPGDTLLAIIGNFEGIRTAGLASNSKSEVQQPVRQKTVPGKPTETVPENQEPVEEPKVEKQEAPKVTVTPSKFSGSKPDVPCKLSIELKWDNKKDNVDLFVCKDNDCVFGGKRYRSFIGYWDSGKARTSIFGGDLRTNQESVRQFDDIIPGTYEILAQYKDSEDPKSQVPLRLQVYTKNDDGVERGNEHYFNLGMNPTQRTVVAKIVVGADGSIEFQSFK